MDISVQVLECVCVGVRLCPSPASLSILLRNNQEETPIRKKLLVFLGSCTQFSRTGEHLAHREHFFPAVILMENIISDGERNSGDG